MEIDYAELARSAVTFHGALQKPKELAAFGKLLVDQDVQSIVEIGTHTGGTAWFFKQLGLEVIAVDIDLSKVVETPGVHYVQASPTELDPYTHVTPQDVASAIAKNLGPVDAVFIDGDHSYEGVLADWLAYRDLATKIIAFHDITEHHPDYNCEVSRLWEQIKLDYACTEIIDSSGPPPNPGYSWAGIGVVFRNAA